MRLVLSGLVAAGLLSSQMAAAACISPADREALDVAGLKTNLMVVTLTCKTDDQYNAFINKWKTELNGDERTAHTYFEHAYGRTGQKRQDEYMTQLANAKADASQHDGSRFCPHNENMFNEVMALQSGNELREYAAGRATAVPASYASCDGTSASPSRPTRRSTTRHRR